MKGRGGGWGGVRGVLYFSAVSAFFWTNSKVSFNFLNVFSVKLFSVLCDPHFVFFFKKKIVSIFCFGFKSYLKVCNCFGFLSCGWVG